MELSKAQKEAVAAMNKAIKMCAKAKLDLCVMDSSFMYAAQSLLKEHPEFGECYTPVADAMRAKDERKLPDEENRIGTFDRSGVHLDGGGW